MIEFEAEISLRPFTTLRAGGAAQLFCSCTNVDSLAEAAEFCQSGGLGMFVLGWGSNILPSDAGVSGVVLLNTSRNIIFEPGGKVIADSGVGFQELFLKTAQRNLGGLEFAVGIPGTLGGALVSNAGAYRSNVSEFITEVEIVHEGRRQWVPKEWMQFSYRDSRLRSNSKVECALLRVRMELPLRDPKAIYDEAREYQRQRISKQPPPASAGSFFKNVNDKELADSLPGLGEGLRKAGVVPAGYLIEHAGLMGTRIGGAMLANRHANFIVNVGAASATEIRQLAAFAREKVHDKYGVELEEEVLYLGDWSGFEPKAVP